MGFLELKHTEQGFLLAASSNYTCTSRSSDLTMLNSHNFKLSVMPGINLIKMEEEDKRNVMSWREKITKSKVCITVHNSKSCTPIESIRTGIIRVVFS